MLFGLALLCFDRQTPRHEPTHENAKTSANQNQSRSTVSVHLVVARGNEGQWQHLGWLQLGANLDLQLGADLGESLRGHDHRRRSHDRIRCTIEYQTLNKAAHRSNVTHGDILAKRWRWHTARDGTDLSTCGVEDDSAGSGWAASGGQANALLGGAFLQLLEDLVGAEEAAFLTTTLAWTSISGPRACQPV